MKKSIFSMNMTDLLCVVVNSLSSIWPLSLLNKYADSVPDYCCGRFSER